MAATVHLDRVFEEATKLFSGTRVTTKKVWICSKCMFLLNGIKVFFYRPKDLAAPELEEGKNISDVMSCDR